MADSMAVGGKEWRKGAMKIYRDGMSPDEQTREAEKIMYGEDSED